MDKLFSSVQNFFQSVTSNDRYADIDSNKNSAAYARRTVSGGFGPSAPLTVDDGSDLSQGSHNPYGSYSSNPSSRNGSSTNLASASNSSLNRAPYIPGMRSARIGSSGGAQGHNNIPLQDYDDGAPPPPPPSLSWKRIDRYLELAYPELADQLEDPVTVKDLNQFETDLGFALPSDVRDSFLVHDGQERGGRPTGVIFGITLLDLEAVAAEWENWKNTAIKVGNLAKAAQANKLQQQQQSQFVRAGPSSAQSPPGPSRRPPGSKPSSFRGAGNLTWLDYQESIPEGAIQKVYAHPAWIPLATDYLGNNIAVDLAPGPNGKWGQVILFGREFDRKFVVASSWAAFLMLFADDLENGRHLVEDETEDGVFLFRAPNGITIPYFDVLKSKTERKYKSQVKQQQQREQLKKQANAQPTQHQQGSHPYGMYRDHSNPNLPGSGSPKHPSGSPVTGPGRNVSSGFRQNGRSPSGSANNGIPGPAGRNVSGEGKLISPLSSSAHLPSAGLTKQNTSPSAPLASPLSASTLASELTTDKPDVHEETIVEEPETISKDTKPSQSKTDEPVSEKIIEPKKQDTKETLSDKSDAAKDEPKDTTPASPKASSTTDTPASPTTPASTLKVAKDESKPATVEEPSSKPTTKTQDSETKETTATDSPAAAEEPLAAGKETVGAESKKDAVSEKPVTHEIQIKDDDSEDEVDLLKDELTEVAI